MLWQRTLAVGPFECNCTVLADTVSREAVVVDPGDEAEKILATLEAAAFKVVGVVHTHAHVDHLGATAQIVEKTQAPGYLHPADRPLLAMLSLQATFLDLPTPAMPHQLLPLKDGDWIAFGGHNLEVIHTPGHSPGSVCLNVVGQNLCLSGDTVFAGGVGRTDLWGGDPFALRRSLRQRILQLPDQTRLVPGHGGSCSVAETRQWLDGYLG